MTLVFETINLFFNSNSHHRKLRKRIFEKIGKKLREFSNLKSSLYFIYGKVPLKAGFLYLKSHCSENNGLKTGGGGIRTHGTLVTYDGFQDRSDKPLWHSSRNFRFGYKIFLSQPIKFVKR